MEPQIYNNKRLFMFSVEAFVGYFLAVYFLMIGIYYSCRTFAMSEREGFSFITYGQRFSRTWWHRHTFNVFRACILIVCVVRLFADIDAYLGVIDFLYAAPLRLMGVILLLLGYGVTTYVAGYMHKDWFSGIAPDQYAQQLVTTGPFSVSRNPLFVGILIGQLGFFFALPSIFSLLCLVVGVSVIWSQSQVEEMALAQRYGDHYQQYRANVARWIKMSRRLD